MARRRAGATSPQGRPAGAPVRAVASLTRQATPSVTSKATGPGQQRRASRRASGLIAGCPVESLGGSADGEQEGLTVGGPLSQVGHGLRMEGAGGQLVGGLGGERDQAAGGQSLHGAANDLTLVANRQSRTSGICVGVFRVKERTTRRPGRRSEAEPRPAEAPASRSETDPDTEHVSETGPASWGSLLPQPCGLPGSLYLMNLSHTGGQGSGPLRPKPATGPGGEVPGKRVDG